MQHLKYPAMILAATAFVTQTAWASESLDIPVTTGGNTATRHLNFYAPTGLSHPPMVIVMHGAGGNGDNLAEAWGWDVIAEREKILIVTPSGINAQWVIWGDDDVNFVKAIIETMASRYDIDRNRVYASGWSMGGMMSYYLACHAPELIAAIGPSSGYLLYGQSGCSTAHNVPIYHVHGIWDDFVKYSNLHDYLNNNWINAFGCPTTADTSDAGTRPDPNTPGTTLREYWGPCAKDGKSSEIYLESYWKGHSYGNQETEVIWNFLKNYSLTERYPGVAVFQYGAFKGRMNRLVRGSYPHTLMNAVGIPDGVMTSLQVDPGLKVELFSNDDFTNPLATYEQDVPDLSAIQAQVTAVRISDASGGGGGAAGAAGAAGTAGAGGAAGNAGAAGGGGDACVADATRAYQGSPASVPGTIEAENFDPAGYWDATPGNEGATYRTDVDVDIKSVDGGNALGWMTAGEWVEYTVNVATAGDYEVTLRAGAVEPGRSLTLSLCGVSVGDVAIPTVSAWGEFSDSAKLTVHLAAGLQQVRVTVGDTDYIDLDSLRFDLTRADPSGAAGTSNAGAGGTGSAGTGGTSGVGGNGATANPGGAAGTAPQSTASSSSGCGCRTARGDGSLGLAAALSLLGLGTLRGRRLRRAAR